MLCQLKSRWRSGLCTAALTAAIAGAALLSAPAASYAQDGGSIVYANTAGPNSLDPHVGTTTVEVETLNQVFEGLLALDEHYQPKPMLASSVQVNDDATVFTFALRHGVKFSNGKEMTSADVQASFERYAAVSSNAVLLGDVDHFDAPDPYSFIVTLKHPNAVFQAMLASPSIPLGIIPAEQKDLPARDATLIGTGPFVVSEWQRDSHLVLTRNPSYTPDESATGPDGFAGRKTVHVDSVRYNFVPEANTRVAALQAGDADVVADVPPSLADTLKAADLTVQQVFPGCMNVAILHTQNPPTDNVKIRQAIAAAVNVDDVIGGAGEIAQRNPSLLYPDSPYYDADGVVPFYGQNNLDKAKQLLQEAGYNGEKIILQTNVSYPPMRDTVLILGEQLQAAGMNVDVQVLDVAANFGNLQKGTKNWNLTATRFCSQPILGPQQWRTFVYNFTQVKGDQVLDDGYQKFLASPAVADRKAAWGAIEQDVLGNAYMIKLADTGGLYAQDSRIQGLMPWYQRRFWDVTVTPKK